MTSFECTGEYPLDLDFGEECLVAYDAREVVKITNHRKLIVTVTVFV